MKCKYQKYFTKYTFNPTKNDLDCTSVQLETELTWKDCKEYRAYFWFMLKIGLGVSSAIWALILGIGFSAGVNDSDFICGLVCGIPLTLLFTFICILMGAKGYDLSLSSEEARRVFADTVEYIELESHNTNEEIRMWEWRQHHPLEEKIRKALESKNSVDIANLLIHLLETETA